jgi:hypothetical protein
MAALFVVTLEMEKPQGGDLGLFLKMVGRAGVEPATRRLRVYCSTN